MNYEDIGKEDEGEREEEEANHKEHDTRKRRGNEVAGERTFCRAPRSIARAFADAGGNSPRFHRHFGQPAVASGNPWVKRRKLFTCV